MRLFVTGFVALVLLAPKAGWGGPIESAWIDLTIEEPMGIAFGTDGCELFWDYVTEISVNGTTMPAGGELTFSTSTLLSLTVEDDGAGTITRSWYEFGPGTARLTGYWWDDNFNIQAGSGEWNGELRGVSIFIYHENPPYDSIGFVDATFGPGTFDDAFASALGVIPQTAGGWFHMGTDQVDGDPSWGRRVGGSTDGIFYATLYGADLPSPVPEPQTWSLLLIGIASLVGWKLRSRQPGRHREGRDAEGGRVGVVHKLHEVIS